MSGARPWQIAVIVIGLTAGIGLSVYTIGFSGNEVEFASKTVVVDLTTGKLYEIDIAGRTLSYPVAHPETGVKSLVPAIKQGSKWMVPEVMRGGLKQSLGGETKAVETKGVVNFETGELTVVSDEPQQLTIPG